MSAFIQYLKHNWMNDLGVVICLISIPFPGDGWLIVWCVGASMMITDFLMYLLGWNQ